MRVSSEWFCKWFWLEWVRFLKICGKKLDTIGVGVDVHNPRAKCDPGNCWRIKTTSTFLNVSTIYLRTETSKDVLTQCIVSLQCKDTTPHDHLKISITFLRGGLCKRVIWPLYVEIRTEKCTWLIHYILGYFSLLGAEYYWKFLYQWRGTKDLFMENHKTDEGFHKFIAAKWMGIYCSLGSVINMRCGDGIVFCI